MYIAKQDFKSYMFGEFKKGDEVQFQAPWLEAGLIEEKPLSQEMETKPEPAKAKKKKGK